ncbi:MAG: PAS domain-containing sensor histidine kinase, partial [Acidobacteriota bacterium]|nr:PAS domain-containing sensor histidine kinase [Acidobacteriota bacterium]
MGTKGEIPPARFRQLSQAVVAIAVGVGISVLFGWWRDIDSLKSLLPGLVSMKANTALTFIFLAVSLWLLQAEGTAFVRKDKVGRWGQGLALLVAVIGLLTFGQYVTGFDLGI